MLRIKVLHCPTFAEVEGIELKRFVPGRKYEVGNRLGSVFLADWAEPVPDDEPALLVPFSEADPFMQRVIDDRSPPNLVRETAPPYADQLPIAPDLQRRKRPRTE